MEIVIRRTLSGLQGAFSSFDWNSNSQIYDTIKYDERNFITKVSKGNKIYKINQTSDYFIYSSIVHILDSSGNTGFYCISVILKKPNLLDNFQEFLDKIDEKYKNSKNYTIDDKNYFSDLYNLAKIEDFNRFVIPNTENLSIIVKSDFNQNIINQNIYTLCFKEVYFFESKWNYDFNYISKEFGKLDYDTISYKYKKITLKDIKENTNNISVLIDGNPYDINNNYNKYIFLLYKNVQLGYRYKNDINNKIHLVNEDFIIEKNIVHNPINNKNDSNIINYENESKEKKNEIKRLKSKKDRLFILSAVLGVLLLVSLIGNGWFVYNYLNTKQEEQNTSDTEFVQIEKDTTDSTKSTSSLSASNNTPKNSSPITPNNVTSKKKNSTTGSSNAVPQNNRDKPTFQDNKTSLGKGNKVVSINQTATTQQGNDLNSDKKKKTEQ